MCLNNAGCVSNSVGPETTAFDLDLYYLPMPDSLNTDGITCPVCELDCTRIPRKAASHLLGRQGSWD